MKRWIFQRDDSGDLILITFDCKDFKFDDRIWIHKSIDKRQWILTDKMTGLGLTFGRTHKEIYQKYVNMLPIYEDYRTTDAYKKKVAKYKEAMEKLYGHLSK